MISNETVTMLFALLLVLYHHHYHPSPVRPW